MEGSANAVPFDSITDLKLWSVRSMEHLLPTFRSSATQHLRETRSAGQYPKRTTAKKRIRLQYFMICESASSHQERVVWSGPPPIVIVPESAPILVDKNRLCFAQRELLLFRSNRGNRDCFRSLRERGIEPVLKGVD